LPERGVYDAPTIHGIVDEALISHVGFVDPDGGFPVVQPMLHARIGDTVYLHGSSGSRQMRALRAGTDVCVTITLLDGLVLARSGFNHSMNYRSVIVLGHTHPVTEQDEIDRVLDRLVEHVSPGRAAQLRPPSRKELAATSLVAVSLTEASAKVRSGGTEDEPEDMSWPVWAGVVPLRLVAGDLQPDDDLAQGVPAPTVRF
jgi:hypothetical protein